MKIVFNDRFYEVYTSDPAAEEGRMESIVSELQDFEFVDAKEADREDIVLVHTKWHYEDVKDLEGI